MNDHRLPPDESASAFLDDELTGTEAEAVRRDPELTARAEVLRQAAEAVGETVTPPPGAADTAVEAALADFDTRRLGTADIARRRPRGLTVITGVAAAVAIGFIVAAAVGLFAERATDDEMESVAASAPAAAPAPADEPDTPPALAMEALEATEATQAAVEPAPAAVAAAEAAPADAQTAADDARAEAAAAQAEADVARDAGAGEEARAAAPAPQPSPTTVPTAADDMDTMDSMDDMDTGDMDTGDMDYADDMDTMEAGDMGVEDTAADDMGPPLADRPTDPLPSDPCAAAIADGSVELRITVSDTPLLVVRSAQQEPTVLNATTCDEIPADEPVEPTPDLCAAAIADGSVELRITVDDTPLLVVRSAQQEPAVLNADTCEGIPPE